MTISPPPQKHCPKYKADDALQAQPYRLHAQRANIALLLLASFFFNVYLCPARTSAPVKKVKAAKPAAAETEPDVRAAPEDKSKTPLFLSVEDLKNAIDLLRKRKQVQARIDKISAEASILGYGSVYAPSDNQKAAKDQIAEKQKEIETEKKSLADIEGEWQAQSAKGAVVMMLSYGTLLKRTGKLQMTDASARTLYKVQVISGIYKGRSGWMMQIHDLRPRQGEIAYADAIGQYGAFDKFNARAFFEADENGDKGKIASLVRLGRVVRVPYGSRGTVEEMENDTGLARVDFTASSGYHRRLWVANTILTVAPTRSLPKGAKDAANGFISPPIPVLD